MTSLSCSKDPVLVGGSSAAINRMDTCGLIMPPADARFVGDHIRLCLQHWQAMRDMCLACGVKRWKFRPKHHYFEHLGQDVIRCQLNPRHFSCFNDESFLGATKRVATRCHSTTTLLRLLQRTILGLGQRFEERRRQNAARRRRR